jgi:hypothetical protein
VTRMTLLAAVLVFACRSTDNNNTADSQGSGSGSGSNMGSGSGSDACTTYTATTIAAMRQGSTHFGCFEFDNVTTVAVTSSTKDPELFVQDAAGGNYSAMMGVCESTSTTHPCTTVSTVTGLADGAVVTVQGLYSHTGSSTFEEFYIANVTSDGSTATPSVATAALADIERGGTNMALRFQKVSVALGSDKLEMYDWSPAEFASGSGAGACPGTYQDGFGMIPASAGVTPGTNECTGSATQPAGNSSPSPKEVLIGTDFYKSFPTETSCCYGSAQPITTSTATGTVSGMLVFDTPFGSGAGYYYLDPTSTSDLTISNLTAIP